MDIKTASMEELMERRTAIGVEVDAEGADLDALEAELRSINEEMENRKAVEAQKAEIRTAVAAGAGEVVEPIKTEEERTTMTLTELRNSAAYSEAFKRYILTHDATECRALLTEIGEGAGNGGVPAPEYVDGIVRTAWDEDPILSRVRRTEIRGILKVAFEKDADPAYVHTEGAAADTEEDLELGIVTMIPANVKKWITVSDEVIALGGEAFVRYVYREVAYQIVKKLASLVVADIANASGSHSDTAVGIPSISEAPSVTAINNAAANLSNEAGNLVVIMNRLTDAAFTAAAVAASFAIDPFYGLPRLYTSALPAYSSASATDVYAIVGDLDGAQVNYPEGDGVVIKYDDLSLAEQDLVKIVGRQYAAHAVTGPGRFCKIKKPSL